MTGPSGTRIRHEFPRTAETRDEWIELSDGIRLFARIVLPVDAGEDPVPALLEYLPYRIVDGTALRDTRHHPWYAGHGYAWRVACETRTSLCATATDFIVSTELEVFEGDERVHRLERTVSIPRDGV